MSSNRPAGFAAFLSLLVLACSPENGAQPNVSTGAFRAADGGDQSLAVQAATSPSSSSGLKAQGGYTFFIPADFNGGIFGVDIDNLVEFSARKDPNGVVSGQYRYVQSAEGVDFIFSGTVTCMAIYDTPVLQRFPDIPAMTLNRVKWGGLIEKSNDPTLPPGGYIWFQSIDNSVPAGTYPDVSTLSGFGDQAANEAFCASANVPNPNFGPHALSSGEIVVR